MIRDIQQYQNVPYPLQPVPDLQDYILTNMQSAGDVHEMYEMSLSVEPREREDEKIARYVIFNTFRAIPSGVRRITNDETDFSPSLDSCDDTPRSV